MPDDVKSHIIQIFDLKEALKQEKLFSQALVNRLEGELPPKKSTKSDEQLIQQTAKTYQKLIADNNVFETLYNKSSDAVILFKSNTTFDCNEAAQKLFELKGKKGLSYKSLLDLSPKNQPDGIQSDEKFYAMIGIAVKNGFHRFEWHNRKENGELFWTDIVLTKIKIDNLPIMHAVFRDISKQKQLEEDIIIERNLAQKANELKSRFLANMSHELRTPMHSILSFSKIGVSKTFESKQIDLRRYFSNINTSGERLMLLLNDLLDLSKLESGKMLLNKESGFLNTVFDSCRLEQQEQIKEKEIALTVLGSEQNHEGTFDLFRIGQVITNLLSNAIKFSPVGNGITVKIITTDNALLKFSIKDQGIGIPGDEKESIFDHFVQSSKTKTNDGGTGLGLAISKEIIEKHSGKIWVENTSGRGSCFCFEIPKDDN